MEEYLVKIKNIVQATEGTKTFYLDKPEDLDWSEGTNIHVALEGFDLGEVPDKELIHHLSVMTLPSEEVLAFTTRTPGSGSQFKLRLNTLVSGDRVTLFKPTSRIPLRREEKPVVLLSMGVGIAAFRTLILSYLKNRSGIKELISINVDRSGDFILRNELDSLSDETYRNFWEKSRSAFYRKYEELSERKNKIFYLVGSDEFLMKMSEIILHDGVSRDNIIFDTKEDKRSEILDAASTGKHDQELIKNINLA